MPSETQVIAPVRSQRISMIKGLVPSLPERGKIKIGNKGAVKQSRLGTSFQPPQKLDHFVVTTLERGADDNFERDDEIHARLGDAPTTIPIRLLYDNPTVNFPTRYACYVGRSLWCHGDGEIAQRLDKEGDGVHEVSCPCPRKEPGYARQDKCKMNGVLSVLIDDAGGIGGVWKFRTTSYNSIVGILSSLAFIRSVTGGVLANIPLLLTLRPKRAQAPDGTPVLIYVVGVEFRGDVAALQATAHQIALDRARTHISIQEIETEARRMLALSPPNAPLPGDVASDVVEEFYPEQVEAALRAEQPAMTAMLNDFAGIRPGVVDPETGEITGDDAVPAASASLDEVLALGDRAADGGSNTFRAWWNHPDVKPWRNAMRDRLNGWRGRATAADQRGDPAPGNEEEDPFGLPPLGAAVSDRPGSQDGQSGTDAGHPGNNGQGDPSAGAGAPSSVRETVPGTANGAAEMRDGGGSTPPAGGPVDHAWLREIAALRAPDWRTYAERFAAAVGRTNAATLETLRISTLPEMQRMRTEDGDLYRSVTTALRDRLAEMGAAAQ